MDDYVREQGDDAPHDVSPRDRQRALQRPSGVRFLQPQLESAITHIPLTPSAPAPDSGLDGKSDTF